MDYRLNFGRETSPLMGAVKSFGTGNPGLISSRSASILAMDADARVLGLSAVFGVLAWFIDALADYFLFYEETFLGLLLTDVPPHEIFIRTIIFVSFLGFGIVASVLIGRVRERETRLGTQRDRIKALHDVGLNIESSESADEVYTLMIEAAETILDFDIAIADSVDGQHLVPEAVSSGLSEDRYYSQTPIDADDNEAARAYRTGESSIIADLHERGVDPADVEFRSALSAPIGDFGVFQAVDREPDAFTSTDLELAEILAAHAREKLARLESNHELRARTEALERQNERLEKFASILSHDLRNPLTVAQGYLDLHREECGTEAELEGIASALDRMEDLIQDILSAARYGQPVQETESIALSSFLQECWSIVESPDASLELVDEMSIWGDPDRLKQLFENLFRNAVEHGGTDVTVRVGQTDTNRLYIADDGTGISEAGREKVFEWGYTTSESGTGLGLSIVKEIAEAHGWTIAITESEAGGARIELTGVDIIDEQ